MAELKTGGQIRHGGGKKKGSAKTGGRKKGTPNKVTREKREMISQFLDDNWDNFLENYKKADSTTQLKIYMELIPYTTPKMASIEYKEKAKPKTFMDELDEISGEKTRA